IEICSANGVGIKSAAVSVRGKTVYLQYSNRQEVVNNKTSADVAGNVLLVTIEGNDARLVSIDVLHLIDAANGIGWHVSRIYLRWQLIAWGERAHVFSAFGFVHKITTFEKTAGFQALVQFTDAETATSAKDALDGRSIPRYLIPELAPCSLKITYSAHTDLSVKFQSHRSRDYTNPMLPVASSAIDASGQTFRRLWLLRKLWKDTAFTMEAFVNNDRSRDYTMPAAPIMNPQPLAAPQYNAATQYMHAPEGYAGAPQSAGWLPGPPSAGPQSTPMHSRPYVPPHQQQGMQYEMGPGTRSTHFNGQNGYPQGGPPPRYNQ
ncbi:hypothetical protein M8C21_026334, partial [Ambrosia artemisiifolia]